MVILRCIPRPVAETAPVIATGEHAASRGWGPTCLTAVGRRPRSRPAGVWPPRHAGAEGATPGWPPGQGSAWAASPSCAGDGPVAGDGPDAGGHVPGARHHDWGGRRPPRRAVSDTRAHAHGGVPAERRAGLGAWCPPPWARAADLGRLTRRPGPRDAGSAGARLAGCGDGPLTAACAPGGRTGRQASIAPERSGVPDTGEVAACGEAGDGHGARAAPHRLAGRHDGGETPALGRRAACRRQALASCVLFRHGSALRLADDRLGGRRTAPCRPPAPRGRPPRGTARRPALRAPQDGL